MPDFARRFPQKTKKSQADEEALILRHLLSS
jgi:hypothetical protein